MKSPSDRPPVRAGRPKPSDSAPIARTAVYACFLLSGATALIFEVLWSNQFVTVFGNSSYAVSVVLCAYMTGLGFGGWLGGRLADRITRRLALFGLIQIAVCIWALAMPWLLDTLRRRTPALDALSPESPVESTLMRFALSLAVLAVPCSLMGATLPLLVRAITVSDRQISRRLGTLYSWNTLGAALGSMAAGLWMLDTLGGRITNLVAAGINLLVGVAALAIARRSAPMKDPEPAERTPAAPPEREEGGGKAMPGSTAGGILLGVAFVNGLAGLACEVLWFRYLAFLLFLGQPAYVFPTILAVYLLGLALGGSIYRWLVGRTQLSVMTLAVVQLSLAVCVFGTFAAGALVFAGGPPPPLGVTGMGVLTIAPPTVLMGIAFPLLCQLYGGGMDGLGRRVGLLLATNTAGTVAGSLAPVFLLVPWLGIQRSLLLVSALLGATGLVLLALDGRLRRRSFAIAVAVYAVAMLSCLLVPANLCQRVFLAMGFNLSKHTDILYYHEGRTGTAILTRDRINQRKLLYVNGNPEAPALYAHQLCFKLLGDLGPLLHPDPDTVLMICFGGGIAAGATECLPEVKSLTIVDLESSVVGAAPLLGEENHRVLKNRKTHVVIDDGRNYIATSRRHWPVIVTDSTHPKAPDSWVLYSREFYQQVQDRLTDDGVFVQWVPWHDLSTEEYKIILRTFQSVFPHPSVWMSAGMDERGQFVTYTLLVATPGALSIDVARLRERLGAEAVRADLEPYGLHTPEGLLDTFLCGEESLRRWVGDGQVNTDDLPYTYYVTRYAQGGKMGNGVLQELREEIWPRLTHTAAGEAGARLRDELALRSRVSRLALAGHPAEAYAMMPDDPRCRRMRGLQDEGRGYVNALANLYWNDPAGLMYAARLGAPGPGTFQNAQRIYERVLEIDPNHVEALNLLGCMHSEAGDLARAEKCLDRAAELAPDSAHVQYNLATLLLRGSRPDDAIAHFRKALKIDPDYADAETNLGTVLLGMGQTDEAIGHYRRALQIDAHSAEACYNLGLALARTSRDGDAIAFYQKALQIRPDDPAILNDLAWELATSRVPAVRNGPRAVALAEKANELTGGAIPPVLHTLAAAYAEAGRFGDAVQNLQRAMEIAQGAGRPDMVGRFEEEMRLYETGQPFRQ